MLTSATASADEHGGERSGPPRPRQPPQRLQPPARPARAGTPRRPPRTAPGCAARRPGNKRANRVVRPSPRTSQLEAPAQQPRHRTPVSRNHGSRRSSSSSDHRALRTLTTKPRSPGPEGWCPGRGRGPRRPLAARGPRRRPAPLVEAPVVAEARAQLADHVVGTVVAAGVAGPGPAPPAAPGRRRPRPPRRSRAAAGGSASRAWPEPASPGRSRRRRTGRSSRR